MPKPGTCVAQVVRRRKKAKYLLYFKLVPVSSFTVGILNSFLPHQITVTIIYKMKIEWPDSDFSLTLQKIYFSRTFLVLTILNNIITNYLSTCMQLGPLQFFTLALSGEGVAAHRLEDL